MEITFSGHKKQGFPVNKVSVAATFGGALLQMWQTDIGEDSLGGAFQYFAACALVFRVINSADSQTHAPIESRQRCAASGSTALGSIRAVDAIENGRIEIQALRVDGLITAQTQAVVTVIDAL